MLQRSGRVAGLIGPYLPSPAKAPPSGPDWLHEIEHDGFRIMAQRDAAGVRLYTRGGHDFVARFPLVVEAIAAVVDRVLRWRQHCWRVNKQTSGIGNAASRRPFYLPLKLSRSPKFLGVAQSEQWA
jgi:hypothetical protein